MMSKEGRYIRNPITHLIWIIFVLLLVISGLLLRSPSGEVLYNYISFASAISSIVLAIVAIFYSIVSNQSFSEAVGSLRISSESVSSDAGSIKEVGDRLTALIDDFSASLDKVPTSVATMSSELQSKLDKLAISEASVLTGSQANPADHKDIPDTLPVGMSLGLYCIKKSFEKNEGFSTDKVVNNRYLAGIIFGTASFIHLSEYYGIVIDKVETNFLSRNLGSFDFDNLETSLRGQGSKYIDSAMEEIDTFFGGDVVASKAEE